MKIAPSVMMIKLVWTLIKNLVEKCVKKFVKGTIHNRRGLICQICQVTPQDIPRVPSCIPPGFPRIPQDSPGFPRIPQDSPGFPGIPRDSPGFPFPGIPQDSQGFPRIPRDSPTISSGSPQDPLGVPQDPLSSEFGYPSPPTQSRRQL